MAKVRKRKDTGKYVIDYRDASGKRCQITAGTNKKHAEAMLAEIQYKLQIGEYDFARKKIAFSEFAHNWMGKYAKPHVKESTYHHYEKMINSYLIPFFGDTHLNRINHEKGQDYLSYMLERGLSPKTINDTMVPFKQMFKHAVSWGYLSHNTVQYVKPLKLPYREMDFFTPDEIRIFLKNVRPQFYPLFLTAVLTGMRQGELLGLKWGDIDWDNCQIKVRRTYSCGKFTTPKSKYSLRSIDMAPTLAKVLKRFRHLKSDLVFCTEKGTPFNPVNLVNREFCPALTRAGLRRIRFHDLRHTYCALLISQGENPKYIQTQMGHASFKTTMDVYGHLMPDANQGARFRLDRTIFGEGCNESATSEKKGLEKNLQPFEFVGSPERTRTADKVVNSHPLYQLSYRGIW